jgi:hypothetical protein
VTIRSDGVAPFLIGPRNADGSGLAVQYKVENCVPREDLIPDPAGCDYLREAMERRPAEGDHCLWFSLQKQGDPEDFPIEDTLEAWGEEGIAVHQGCPDHDSQAELRLAGAAGVLREPVVQSVARPRGPSPARRDPPRPARRDESDLGPASQAARRRAGRAHRLRGVRVSGGSITRR